MTAAAIERDWVRDEEGDVCCAWCQRPMRYLLGPDAHYCAYCWNAVWHEEIWKAER